MKYLALLLVLFLSNACAHQIRISPDLAKLEAPKSAPKASRISLVMTAQQKAQEYASAASGGDRVAYFPYRDLESGIYKVLSDHFEGVETQGAKLQAIPTIVVTSAGNNVFTWMPTEFTVRIHLSIKDAEGTELWSGAGVGMAVEEDMRSMSERMNNFGNLAGLRALQDLSRKLDGFELKAVSQK